MLMVNRERRRRKGTSKSAPRESAAWPGGLLFQCSSVEWSEMNNNTPMFQYVLGLRLFFVAVVIVALRTVTSCTVG